MKHDQCCENQPVLEVLYDDPRYNEGKPIKVCKDHWNRDDKDGNGKVWQIGTKEVKILEASS